MFAEQSRLARPTGHFCHFSFHVSVSLASRTLVFGRILWWPEATNCHSAGEQTLDYEDLFPRCVLGPAGPGSVLLSGIRYTEVLAN